MEDLTFKDIQNLGFEIEENIQHVAQYYRVNLDDNETKISEFEKGNIDSELIDSNYDLSETTYSISKGSHMIEVGLTNSELIDFFTSGEYKEY